MEQVSAFLAVFFVVLLGISFGVALARFEKRRSTIEVLRIRRYRIGRHPRDSLYQAIIRRWSEKEKLRFVEVLYHSGADGWKSIAGEKASAGVQGVLRYHLRRAFKRASAVDRAIDPKVVLGSLSAAYDWDVYPLGREVAAPMIASAERSLSSSKEDQTCQG